MRGSRVLQEGRNGRRGWGLLPRDVKGASSQAESHPLVPRLKAVLFSGSTPGSERELAAVARCRDTGPHTATLGVLLPAAGAVSRLGWQSHARSVSSGPPHSFESLGTESALTVLRSAREQGSRSGP
jgi:hypothetical protein